MKKIGIIGLGFVGNAIHETVKKISNISIYDKFKNGGMGSLKECLNTDILFLSLPTQYDSVKGEYNKDAIYEVCQELTLNNYQGAVIIKSTVEPETTDIMSEEFPQLQLIHNPEFLTARTAVEDFANQKHIVLGKGNNCTEEKLKEVCDFYKELFPEAEISLCSSLESESMKIFCNSFYAVKIQFFTELYLTCQKNGSDYNKVKDMMIKNKWINPMHTTIPGTDGQISYGGLCFPKETNALLKYMEKNNVSNSVLNATVTERELMRDDHNNIY
jgi:UDPglucose 6-dehydrogenase